MARAMKDSGVEWIGEIPEEWQIGRIGQLYTERREKVSDTEYQPLSVTMKGVLPQLSTAAKTDAHDDRKLVRVGDFAINSRSDRRGSCGISPYEGSVSLINTILMPRNEMHPVYYNWLFHSTMFSDEFYKWGHGIVNDLWTTNWQDMKRIAVPMPPLEEQSRIAYYLNAECARIDAVIEQTRASIEEYKKLKQSVITEAVTKGIRPGRNMKDSGVEWIGEIPESFTRRKLKTFSEIVSKGTTPKEMKTEFNDIYTVRYIKSENIVANRLQELPLFTITEQIHFGELQRSKLSDRDILFVIAGASIGKVAIMRKDMLPANTNQATCFIRINTQYLKYQKYIWYVLQADFIKTYIQLFAVQSAQPNLSMADLGDLFIPIPSEEDEVYHITEYLDSICAHIDFLTNQKEQLLLDLESYKKSLIFEYVTGKKEIK